MDTFQEDVDAAISQACEIHGVESLKDLQVVFLKTLLEDRDVLGVLPTGFGKSLICQAWPTVCSLLSTKYPDKWPKEALVLIVSPLQSTMEEQVNFLNEKGLSAAVAGKNKHTDERICNGDFSFVYGSPETFVDEDFWRLALQARLFSERLIGFAVDDVHTVFQRGETDASEEQPFRKWCGMVRELRSLLPKAVPLLALTATTSKNIRKKMVKNLGMKRYVEIVKRPDRVNNIRLAVKKISAADPSETFAWLIQELESQGRNTEKYVIYCESISDCSLLYYEVLILNLGKKGRYPIGAKDVSGNRLVDMYHSCTAEDVKLDIVHSLQDPSSVLRVVVATSALGVDFRGVNHVIHYGPPRDIESYMEAYGRAERDSSSAHSLILYRGKQLKGVSDQMKQYLADVTTCRRVKLFNLFDGEKADPLPVLHKCCSNCATSCECTETCDGQMSALERHAGEEPASRERTVSAEQTVLLQERLEDMTQDMTDEGLYGGLSLCCATHLINAVIEKSSVLFTIDDIFCINVQVSNAQAARAILSILRDVFDDVDEDSSDEDEDY